MDGLKSKPTPEALERAAQHDFGGCPECGGTDGYTNVGRNHWFICDAHRTRWCAGSNLFSSWQDETEAEQRARWEKVADYREVEPIHADYHPPEEKARSPEPASADAVRAEVATALLAIIVARLQHNEPAAVKALKSAAAQIGARLPAKDRYNIWGPVSGRLDSAAREIMDAAGVEDIPF